MVILEFKKTLVNGSIPAIVLAINGDEFIIDKDNLKNFIMDDTQEFLEISFCECEEEGKLIKFL